MNKIDFKCANCGKLFEAWLSQRTRKLHFCSYECKAKNQKGKHHGGNTGLCAICGVTFYVKPSAVKKGRRCCTAKCRDKLRKTLTGAKSPRWKGGVYKHTKGYLEEPVVQVAGKAKRMLQHRRIMERHLGRILKRKEVVHHKDGNKQNNNISNLIVMSASEHNRFHAIKSGLGKHKRKYANRNYQNC